MNFFAIINLSTINGIRREPEGETAKQTRTEEEEEEERKLQKMGKETI